MRERAQTQMTVGTAQFGMPYGINNSTGMPSPHEISRIVHRAIEHGVTSFDTARSYGESELRLGEALAGGWHHRATVITKLAPIEDGSGTAVRAAVETSVIESCRALRVDRLDVLLLHRAHNLRSVGGAVWERLLQFKAAGMVGRLGVSVQNRDELALAEADPHVEVIQLPFNLLDRRWAGRSTTRGDLEVHVRSVFLQGLLIGAPADRWPRMPRLDPEAMLSVLKDLVGDLGRASLSDLAIAFVRAHGWVDSLVIGVETDAQLADNLRLFANRPLDAAEVELVRQRVPAAPETLLDPAQWRTH